MQVELIQCSKNMFTLFTNQVSNTNNFGSVSDILGRLAVGEGTAVFLVDEVCILNSRVTSLRPILGLFFRDRVNFIYPCFVCVFYKPLVVSV